MVAVAVTNTDTIERDLQRAVAVYGQNTLREWRQALTDFEQRLRGYAPEQDRAELVALADHLRFAVQAFERAITEPTALPLQDRPADHLRWLDLTGAVSRDEQAGWELWAQVKAAAAAELASGKAGADAIEGYDAAPWQRAQYLALRSALADGLLPRNGLEWMLVDGMAQALTMQRHWLHKHVLTESLDAQRVKRDTDSLQEWQPPRLTDVQAVDRAAMMSDRFHRQFLRLLKSFRDGRKLVASMTVLGGQVNVGEQQVIATRSIRSTPPRRGSQRAVTRRRGTE